jgi:hypothetical protein
MAGQEGSQRHSDSELAPQPIAELRTVWHAGVGAGETLANGRLSAERVLRNLAKSSKLSAMKRRNWPIKWARAGSSVRQEVSTLREQLASEQAATRTLNG